MKKHLLVTLIVVSFFLRLDAQSLIRSFQVPANNDIFGKSVIQAKDKGFLLASYYKDYISSVTSSVVVKTDSNLQFQWGMNYIPTGTSFGCGVPKICESKIDSSVYISAIYSTALYSVQTLLMKIDKNGALLWAKLYLGIFPYVISEVSQSESGSVFISGTTGDEKIFLIKTDSNGNFLWGKTYLSSTDSYCTGMIVLPDDKAILCANVIFGGSYQNVILIKIDGDGNLIWDKIYGGVVLKSEDGILKTKNHGILVHGWSVDGNPAGTIKLFLMQADSIGSVEWTKTYYGAGLDNSKGISLFGDLGYAVACSTNSVIAIDTLGIVKWAKEYNPGTEFNFEDIVNSKNGELVLTGNMGSPHEITFLLKLDSSGTSNCNQTDIIPVVSVISPTVGSGCSMGSFGSDSVANFSFIPIVLNQDTSCMDLSVEENTRINKDILIFPNPSSEYLSLKIPPLLGEAELHIFNSLGQEVSVLKINKAESSVTIDVTDLSSGVYFVKMINYSGRFVKQ